MNAIIRQFNALSLLCFSLMMPLLSFASTESFVTEDHVQSLLKNYSKKEISLIRDDFSNIQQMCFRDTTPVTKNERQYISTAGGPCTGKSTLLENYIRDKKNFVYLDPDQRALRYMINTYLQEFSNGVISELKIHTRKDWETHLRTAYNKWRGASNYIALTLLNKAFKNGNNIAHGTTSTSDQMEDLYKKLKGNGYKITLLLSYSPLKDRLNAVTHRTKNQNLVQNDIDDVQKKGKLFPVRMPIYFKYADELQLYWTDNFLKGPILAATLKKGKNMIIHDAMAMKKFTKQYDDERKGQALKSLEALIQEYIK